MLAAEIVAASDHEKQTIDRIDFWFTVSGDHIAKWSSEALFRADETPVVHVHPDALGAGYRIVDVTLDHGYRGPYQRIGAKVRGGAPSAGSRQAIRRKRVTRWPMRSPTLTALKSEAHEFSVTTTTSQ